MSSMKWYGARPAFDLNRMDTGNTLRLITDFFAILGSILGASTMSMLLDHRAEIGYCTVEKVVLFGYKRSPEMDDYEKARSMMIILTDHRQRPIRIPKPNDKHRLFTNRLSRSPRVTHRWFTIDSVWRPRRLSRTTQTTSQITQLSRVNGAQQLITLEKYTDLTDYNAPMSSKMQEVSTKYAHSEKPAFAMHTGSSVIKHLPFLT